MRKLATNLDVEAMSLYNHIKDKQDLLNGLCDLVLSRIELPAASLPWDLRLETFANNLYQALVQHPPIVFILASEQGYPADNNVILGMDSLLAALAESGLNPQRQVNAYRGLLAMCFGFVLAHTRGLSSTKEQAQAIWDSQPDRPRDPETLPHLAQLAPHFTQTHADDDFKFMLDAYLTALRTTIQTP